MARASPFWFRLFGIQPGLRRIPPHFYSVLPNERRLSKNHLIPIKSSLPPHECEGISIILSSSFLLPRIIIIIHNRRRMMTRRNLSYSSLSFFIVVILSFIVTSVRGDKCFLCAKPQQQVVDGRLSYKFSDGTSCKDAYLGAFRLTRFTNKW